MASRTSFFFLISSCFGLASCSHSTAPEPSSYPTDFTYENSHTFDQGTDTTIERILTTGATFAGKSNVTIVQDSTRGIIDTFYFSWEANGDVSVYTHPERDTLPGLFPAATIVPWLTMPIASGKKYTFRQDTIYARPRGSDTVIATDTVIKDTGEAIGGTELNLPSNEAISFQSYVSTANATGTTVIGTASTVFYAPSLHYFVESAPDISSAFFGKHKQGFMSFLIGWK